MLIRAIINCTLFLTLIGCAGTGIQKNRQVEAKSDHRNRLAAAEELSLESHIEILDPRTGESVLAVVKQGYVSALGQRCYRIISVRDTISGLNVLCQDSEGNWAVVPSVQSDLKAESR